MGMLGKPPRQRYSGSSNHKQPHGKSIGIHDPGVNQKQHTSFESEAREHHAGNVSRGTGKEHGGSGAIANTGGADRGTHLVGQSNEGHAGQPHGKSIGAGSTGARSRIGMAEHHGGTSHGGAAHCFPGVRTGNSYQGGRKAFATNPVKGGK